MTLILRIKNKQHARKENTNRQTKTWLQFVPAGSALLRGAHIPAFYPEYGKQPGNSLKPQLLMINWASVCRGGMTIPASTGPARKNGHFRAELDLTKNFFYDRTR